MEEKKIARKFYRIAKVMIYTNDDNNLTFVTSSRSMGSLGGRNEDLAEEKRKEKSAHKFYRIAKIMTYTKLINNNLTCFNFLSFDGAPW